MATNPNRITVTELATELSCRKEKVHEEADRLGLPHVVRHGVNGRGEPIVRRVYLRKPIEAALDEMGRKSQRVAS